MPTLDIYLRRLDGSHRRIRSSPDTTFRDSALTRQDYWFTKPEGVIRAGRPAIVDSWSEVEEYDVRPSLEFRKSVVIVDEGSPHAVSYGDAPTLGWVAKETVPDILTLADNTIRSAKATDDDKVKAVKVRLNAETNKAIREEHRAQRMTMRHIRMERAKSRAGKADLDPPILKIGFLVIVACVVLTVIIFASIVGAAFLESRQVSQPLPAREAAPTTPLSL